MTCGDEARRQPFRIPARFTRPSSSSTFRVWAARYRSPDLGRGARRRNAAREGAGTGECRQLDGLRVTTQWASQASAAVARKESSTSATGNDRARHASAVPTGATSTRRRLGIGGNTPLAESGRMAVYWRPVRVALP